MQEFDREEWMRALIDDGRRVPMANRLVTSRALIGKSRAAVIEMLGPPSNEPHSSMTPHPSWNIGYWDPTGFDSGTTLTLIIEFKRGLVAAAYTQQVRADEADQ